MTPFDGSPNIVGGADSYCSVRVGGSAVWGWIHWPLKPAVDDQYSGGWTNGVLLHACVHVSPFAVRANSSTGSVGRGHMWLPLVHVHVVHGSPEIVGAANSICSERVSSFCRHCMVLCPLVSWWLLCRVRYGR